MYDDDNSADAEKPAAAAAPAVDENSEEVLVPKYTEAIALGMVALQMLTSQQQADKQQEQPQGEGAQPTGDQAEKPKHKKEKVDLYLRQPLPYVVSTKEFLDDEYCGLYIEGNQTNSLGGCVASTNLSIIDSDVEEEESVGGDESGSDFGDDALEAHEANLDFTSNMNGEAHAANGTLYSILMNAIN